MVLVFENVQALLVALAVLAGSPVSLSNQMTQRAQVMTMPLPQVSTMNLVNSPLCGAPFAVVVMKTPTSNTMVCLFAYAVGDQITVWVRTRGANYTVALRGSLSQVAAQLSALYQVTVVSLAVDKNIDVNWDTEIKGLGSQPQNGSRYPISDCGRNFFRGLLRGSTQPATIPDDCYWLIVAGDGIIKGVDNLLKNNGVDIDALMATDPGRAYQEINSAVYSMLEMWRRFYGAR